MRKLSRVYTMGRKRVVLGLRNAIMRRNVRMRRTMKRVTGNKKLTLILPYIDVGSARVAKNGKKLLTPVNVRGRQSV